MAEIDERETGNVESEIRDIEDLATCEDVEIHRKRPAEDDPAPFLSRKKVKLAVSEYVDSWFKHTNFGCMKSRAVTHFEPSLTCAHKCIYCYVNGYVCGPSKRTPSCALVASETDLREATAIKYARMWKNRARQRADVLEMLPELHFSISTDVLQPDPTVQETFYVVAKKWLELGGLISVVSKGVPYDPQFRTKLLELFAKYNGCVSYQGTCASLDEEAQRLLEPGTPKPQDRLEWLGQVAHLANVKRVSLRINALVPGINDDSAGIRNLLDWAAAHGIKRAAVSYMYGSRKIFKEMRDSAGVDVSKHFVMDTVELNGGTGKFHVLAERRIATTEDAKKYGKKIGVLVSSCGCDNGDIYKTDKCGISWRSGGRDMNSPVEPTPEELKAEERRAMLKAKKTDKKKNGTKK